RDLWVPASRDRQGRAHQRYPTDSGSCEESSIGPSSLAVHLRHLRLRTHSRAWSESLGGRKTYRPLGEKSVVASHGRSPRGPSLSPGCRGPVRTAEWPRISRNLDQLD